MFLFVYGPDYLRVKERTEELKQKFVEKYDPALMNVDDIVVRAGQLPDVQDILQAVQAAPFMSERRLVIVRGLLEVIKKADAKNWGQGLLRTPSSTVVLFADELSGDEFEKKDLVKILLTSSDVHKYPLVKLSGEELVAWAFTRANKLGLVISPALVRELLNRTNGDTWRTDAELKKLAAFANGETVTFEMLEELVRFDYSSDIFGLMDALSAGNSKQALDKLLSERASGADNFQLFGMLLRQLRLVLRAKSVLESKPNCTKQDLATSLSVHPFVAQKLLTEAKAWSMNDLVNLHELAGRLDQGMKSGIRPDVAVDRLLAEWLT